MMNGNGGLHDYLVGVVAIVGSAVVGAVVWIINLGARVSALEARMKTLEATQALTRRETLDSLAAMRAETEAIVGNLAAMRQEAARTFAEKADLRSLDTKLDRITTMLIENRRGR